ncbi:MAG TPA: hypothetical protein VEH29_09595 [Acidimicrobiales bacterium]|nr:hypothetical protein [Acidimicrobiales bacterium]
MASELEQGILVGLLVGEGHFGGDGRQPQITLRMHIRHESLFHWLERTFPGGRLYGPYSHGGREYYQWMVRGAYLRDEILPMLESAIQPQLDAHTHARLEQMKVRYPGRLQASGAAAATVRDSRRRIGYVTPGGTDVIDPHATIQTED